MKRPPKKFRKKKNLPKESDNSEEKELTEEDKFVIELKDLNNKLKDFKFLFKNNNEQKLFDKFENNIILEQIIDYKNIEKKFRELFPSEDIFLYLYQTWNKVLEYCTKQKEEKKELEDFQDEIDSKSQSNNIGCLYSGILMNIHFFILYL